MHRILLMTALLLGCAQATQISGTIQNWSAYKAAMPQGGQMLPLTEAKSPTIAIGKGSINPNGSFTFTLDDAVSEAMSSTEPNCASAQKTPGMRTLVLPGMVLSDGKQVYRLTREAKQNGVTIVDALLYSNKPGSIAGHCDAGRSSLTYRLILTRGWNEVRVVTTAQQQSAIFNFKAPKSAAPWLIHQ